MTQPTLFDEGEDRKEEGIGRVIENTGERWKRVAAAAVAQLARELEPFTIDDLKKRVLPHVGAPHHYNAWGAVMNRGARRGLIRMTGRLVASNQASCHAHKNPEWIGCLR